MTAAPPDASSPNAIQPDGPWTIASRYLRIWGESPASPAITSALLLSHIPASRAHPSLRPSFKSSILFSSVLALSSAMMYTDPDGAANGAGVMGAWSAIYLGLHGRPKKIRTRGFPIRAGVCGLMVVNAVSGVGVFSGVLGGRGDEIVTI